MKSTKNFRTIQYLAVGQETAALAGVTWAIKLFICLLFIYLIAAGRAHGQSRQVVNQSIQWLSLNSNIKLNKKYGVTVDGQFRFAEHDNMQHMFRAGFEYYVTKKLSVVPIGYSYIQNYLYGKQPASYINNERRIWQQIAYKHAVSRVAISHRLRFEERFIGVHTKDANDQVVSNGFTNQQFRVRYRAMANIPLNHAKMEPKTYYISVWDEIFVSHGKSITYNEPDQNRIFVGPGYQITKKLAVQGGPFYQLLIKSNGTKQENNVGFLLQMNYNFDLSK
jgi:Protein of unknown function (DUF2490)